MVFFMNQDISNEVCDLLNTEIICASDFLRRLDIGFPFVVTNGWITASLTLQQACVIATLRITLLLCVQCRSDAFSQGFRATFPPIVQKVVRRRFANHVVMQGDNVNTGVA